MSIIQRLKRIGIVRMIFHYYTILVKSHFKFYQFRFLSGNLWFWKDYWRYRSQKKNEKFKLSIYDIWPYTEDRSNSTPLDPMYFYQDCWLAKKIFKNRPTHHYDVGSMAKTIGLLSQFVPITMIDIRPVELPLENLHFIKGTILKLPFADNSIESISSICVIEHIGLGRYGDPLDSFGSEKAIIEIQRVTKPGGKIYVTLPVDEENKIYFNGCRAFTPEYIKSLFGNCELLEEKYIYGKESGEKYLAEKGFGVGMYDFRKIK